MAGAKSATDVISPAFERTKRQLLSPFRMGTWARLAVIAILSGEMGSGGWNNAANFNLPSSGKPGDKLGLAAFPPGIDELMKYLPYILIGVVAAMCLGAVLLYVQSVFRFVLFDAVLRGRCGIREGWRRWRDAGSNLFLWQMGFELVMLTVTAVVFGLPALWVWRTKIYEHAEENIGLLILLGLLAVTVFAVLVVAAMLVDLAARDFVVPVMAMENVRVMEGWRRVLPMLGAEKGAYAFYVVMKIALSLGIGILLGIAATVVVLALLIPVGMAAAAVVVAAAAAGLSWNVYTIGAAIAAGAAGIVGMMYLMAFVYAPGMVFFQAYTLEFLGARYARLGAELAPPAPPAQEPSDGGALPAPGTA